MFNKIDDDFDEVAIKTLKVGLPIEHDLRKSLTMKPVRSVRQLMNHIDKYKRVEEDQQQSKGKAKAKQILEKIRHESYFKWPNKMARDPMKRNQNLHCHYHQKRCHTTENCTTLWNHLEQLVREGRLKQFLYRPNGQGDHSGSVNQGNNALRPPLGTINVIFTALGRTGSCPTRVMSVSRTLANEYHSELKKD
ncbi:uncharacterized protein LOC142634975 [Castanea sativa]|uniref:uncharacterized protein LOC142634975 n=1 Tax=Castanea sativa TaxID=21020 RepID=UPI003F64A097